jgi:hypothetical protein
MATLVSPQGLKLQRLPVLVQTRACLQAPPLAALCLQNTQVGKVTTLAPGVVEVGPLGWCCWATVADCRYESSGAMTG